MPAKDRILFPIPVQDLRSDAIVIAVGDRFGRLVVVSGPLGHRDSRGVRVTYYECRCDCGTVKPINAGGLLRGTIQSCRCLHRQRTSETSKKHGRTPAQLYGVWQAMKRRCRNENDPRFHRYGGRGIRVCPEWESSYEAFRDWAFAHGYHLGLTIERNDNDGDYCPTNCRWATWVEQSHNKQTSFLITAFGETKVLSQWAVDPRCTLTGGGLRKRILCGWSPELAITAPRRKSRHEGDGCTSL